MSVGGLAFVISGLVVGLAFGVVLQRGRFCVNTGFRDILLLKDFTMFRAYLLAVVVAMVGANLIESAGLLTNLDGQLYRQHFFPVANALGGYLFGLGIVLAGGCGSGILYRVGEGLMAAWVAVLGFFLGIAITSDGLLKGFNRWIHVGGKESPEWLKKILMVRTEAGGPVTMYSFSDAPWAKWAVIVVISAVFLAFIMKGKPFGPGSGKGFKWSVAGLLGGLMAIAAFYASDKWGGGARGLSFTGPLKEFMYFLMQGESGGRWGDFALFGSKFKVSWSALYVFGVPIGAYLSAKSLKEFKWKTPPAEELLTVFLGAMLMGFGSVLGGG